MDFSLEMTPIYQPRDLRTDVAGECMDALTEFLNRYIGAQVKYK